MHGASSPTGGGPTGWIMRRLLLAEVVRKVVIDLKVHDYKSDGIIGDAERMEEKERGSPTAVAVDELDRQTGPTLVTWVSCGSARCVFVSQEALWAHAACLGNKSIGSCLLRCVVRRLAYRECDTDSNEYEVDKHRHGSVSIR
nr:hypothetical protein CFP56_76139 [Quercus suber]